MFRLANARRGKIKDLEVQVSARWRCRAARRTRIDTRATRCTDVWWCAQGFLHGAKGRLHVCGAHPASQGKALCVTYNTRVAYSRIRAFQSLQPSLEQYPWTVMHEIDDDSLFARDSWDAVCASMDLVLVHVKGVDMIVNSQIFAEKAYPLERIKLNMALQDMVKNTDVNTPNGHKERHQVVNYKNFHRVVPRVSERFGCAPTAMWLAMLTALCDAQLHGALWRCSWGHFRGAELVVRRGMENIVHFLSAAIRSETIWTIEHATSPQ